MLCVERVDERHRCAVAVARHDVPAVRADMHAVCERLGNEFPARRAALLGLLGHQGQNLFESGLVVCFGVDRADVHVFLRGRSGHFNGFCVHCVVLLVDADKLHVDDLQLVRNGHDQPIVIAFDVPRLWDTRRNVVESSSHHR